MGATFSIVLYGSDRASMNQAMDAAFEEVHRLDAMLSNYLPASEWSRINREAAERPVVVSPELFGILSDCIEYSRTSEGTFDLTVGPLMRAWGFTGGGHQVPSPDQIREALELVGYRHVQLNARKRTVRFDRPRCGDRSRRSGQGVRRRSHGRVSSAREVFATRSSPHPAAVFSAWATHRTSLEAGPFSIADPWDHRKNAAQVFLKDLSLSTSGSYEKSFRSGGHRYSHIMDPRRGVPAESAVQVTVIAPRTIDSEVWAKPYFILGCAWTATHKPKSWRVLYCENTPGAACSWVE